MVDLIHHLMLISKKFIVVLGDTRSDRWCVCSLQGFILLLHNNCVSWWKCMSEMGGGGEMGDGTPSVVVNDVKLG